MNLNKYDTLNEIDTSSYEWKTRVRLQVLWKSVNRTTNDFYGLNMIFIDDCNSRIHAFASKKHCADLLDKLKEGDIYILSNFRVKEIVGDETYRPVRTNKHIFFTIHTKIEKNDEDGLQIEDYAFDLFDIVEIEDLANDNRFLIDIVGKVENIQGIIRSKKNEHETIRKKFDISDGRFRVNVTFFDLIAMQVEEAFTKLDHNDIFVIISGGKVGRFEELPNITNYPATRIHINPIHYSIAELKEKMLRDNDIEMTEVDKELPKKLHTVKEIRTLSPDFKETKVNVDIVVKKIDEKAKWYYCLCTDCDIEILSDKGDFICSKCKRLYPYPEKRFRIATICSDHTGSIPIIFLDREVTRLTDKTVVDIHCECLKEEDEDKFPEILRMFLNRKYTITLNISEENRKKGCTVYTAYEIAESMDVCDSYNPIQTAPTELENMSTGKDTQEQDSKDGTPLTGHSTNMKTRARKNVEPVTYDVEKPTKPKTHKNVKIEKN